MATTLTVSGLEQLLEKISLSTPVPQYPSSDVLNKPLDLCRSYLADILSNIVECDAAVAYGSIQLSNDPLHGDFTVVLPRLSPGAKGAKAEELAIEIINKFPPNPLFEPPFPDNIWLRFCMKPGELPRLFIPYINERKESYGRDSVDQIVDTKNMVVEFSSPNIASEFQGKHLRSTILGAFLSSLYQFLGWEVTKVNYLGDWGKDIALLGVGWQKFGSEEEFSANPASHLLDVYHKIRDEFLPEQEGSRKARDEAKKNGQDEQEATAEIEGKGIFAERNAFFKKMEEGDEEALALSKRIREVNIANYTDFYGRMGIAFDEYAGESQVSHGIVAELEQTLKEKGLAEESGGALVIDMKKLNAKSGTAIVRDRTGSTTYFMRYLASILERSRKQAFDKMIFVAADRNGHFSRLFKVFEALGMGELASKLEHVQFNDTSHMAEKLGQNYQPHDILDRCEEIMREVLKSEEAKVEVIGKSEEAVKATALSALLVQELSTKKASDHAFDIANMTSFKTGTGPELQYQYARLCSILKENPYNPATTDEDYQSLTEDTHTSLLLTLGLYPETVEAAMKTGEPAQITAYLHTVLDKLNEGLDEDEEEEGEGEDEGEGGRSSEKGEKAVQPGESALYEASRIVLEHGMKLLGLTPIATSQPHRADTPIAD